MLVTLTAYFAEMQREEQAQARLLLGQDRVTATANPIAALREPVARAYREGCAQALAAVATSPEARRRLGAQTPLLASLTPVLPVPLAVASARARETARVVFTTSDHFGYRPELTGEEARAPPAPSPAASPRP